MTKPYFLLLCVFFLLTPFTTLCWDIFGGGSERCSPRDIRINQVPSGFTALNIPKYTVQIVNEAWQANAVFGIEISCAGFASANLIDPKIFRRFGFFTCLLMDGKKINRGQVVTFEYSNILPYPLSVVQVQC